MRKPSFKPLLTMAVLLATAIFAMGATAQRWPLKANQTSNILVMNALKASQQGKSGIALDLDGDDKRDLVIGAPYARHKKGLGALLIYKNSKRGFSKRPQHIVIGHGNLGWNIVALEDASQEACFAAGASNDSGNDMSPAGTVTIFSCKGKPSPELTLGGENAFDKFGFTMATGDLNDDGYKDLIVGAPMHSPSPALYQKGALYIFWGPDFDQESQLKVPAGSSVNGLGRSLATGDINDDGIVDLLAGASGMVAGYYGSPEFNLIETDKPDLTVSGRDQGFGSAITVLPDVNDDGFSDIAIGAQKATIEGQVYSGRLFIIKGGEETRTINGDQPSEDILAKIDGEPSCGLFASTLQPVGDVDDDGLSDLAVGAVHADGDWPMTGAVYLFSGRELSDTDTTIASADKIPGKAKDMHFGEFLAMVEEGGILAAGAPTEKKNTGTVRLLDLTLDSMD